MKLKLDDELVQLIEENRTGLFEVLDSVKKIRGRVDTILPQDTNEYKNRYLLEGKLKTVTEIISNELRVRKSIDESIKMQFELQRKAEYGADGEQIDIHLLAKLMERKEREDKVNQDRKDEKKKPKKKQKEELTPPEEISPELQKAVETLESDLEDENN